MDLKLILKRHKKWLKNEVGGERANLRGADLSGADLSWTDLSGANLSWTDLRGANLRGTDLSGANLSGADLSWTDLSGTDLRGADLSGANLRGVNFSGACLRGAELRWVDFRGEHNNKYIEPYEVIYIENFIAIGCKTYSREGWKNFSDETIAAMDLGVLVWWKKNKKHVLGGR